MQTLNFSSTSPDTTCRCSHSDFYSVIAQALTQYLSRRHRLLGMDDHRRKRRDNLRLLANDVGATGQALPLILFHKSRR